MTKFVNKFQNLRTNSGRFFAEFIKNRKQQMAVFRGKPKTALGPGSVKSTQQYSVVSAIYNVSPYLDEFFKSLFRQTLDFRNCIEFVMVDDGSTDDSARIIKEWQRKYPNNIKYVRKENGGQASARNLGLQHVTGRWVTFIDPDDFIAADYFAEVDEVLAASKAPLGIVSCNFIFYFEDDKRFSDTHPMKFRFAKGTQTVDFSKPTSHLQLSVNSAFFDAQIIERHEIRFDERVKPNFEDAQFANLYLMYVRDRNSVFCASAKYFYRKRSNGTSSLDTAWEKEGLYGDVLEHGVLALLRAWAEHTGSVPVFVQRVALYHLTWYFKRLINKDDGLSFLDDRAKVRFVDLVHLIFAYIDFSTINAFELAGIWFMYKVGMMLTFKGEEPTYQIVYVESADLPRKLVKVRYFSKSVGFESFKFNGAEIQPVFTTSQIHTFANSPFVQERIVWLPLQQHATLSVELGSKKVTISFNKKQHSSVPMADIAKHFALVSRSLSRAASLSDKSVARLATRRNVQEKYGDAWVFVDRDIQADDNAEHLYRYLQSARPDVNAWFVLRRSSHDWKRLKQDGFRLVPFGSVRHKLLMLNAKHLISSNIDNYIVNAVKKSVFGGRLNHRLIFLQHGVILNDLADWLNSKDPDLFVTTAPRERDAIIGTNSRYKFSGREVVMTGLPRHDRLLASASVEKMILIMPTWRKSSLGASKPGTFAREINPEFTSSEYFRQWSALLQNEALLAVARKHGYKIVFYQHANMQQYDHLFRVSDNVEVRSHTHGSIQDMFRSAAMMITDYSSVNFEFAHLRRPLIYFQFDRQEVFAGTHSWKKGYFDYETDGFGPVLEQCEEVVAEVSAVLQRGGAMAPEYFARAEAFLPLRDGRNCERTVEAIFALDKPAVASPVRVEDALEALEQAVAVGKWSVTAERAERILAMSGIPAAQRAQAAGYCAQAYRELGDLDAAQRVLESESLEVQNDVAVTLALAKIATMRADWSEAVARWESALNRLGEAREEKNKQHLYVQNEFIRALLHARRESDAIAVATRLLDSSGEEGVVLPAFAEISHVALGTGDLALARRFALAVLNSPVTSAHKPSAACAIATLATVFEQRNDLMMARSLWMRAVRSDESGETYAAGFDAVVDQQENWSAARWTEARETSSMFAYSLDAPATSEAASELDAALTLCAMHRARGEMDAATQVLNRVKQNHPDDLFVHLEAAELALAVNNLVDAEEQFAKAYGTPGAASLKRVARGLVVARQTLGKLDGLEALASAATAQRTNDLPLARACALLAFAESRWDDALAAWRTVVELSSPEGMLADVKDLIGFAQALRGLGRLDEAQNIVSALLARIPGNAAALAEFAQLAIEREDWALAIAASGELEKIASSVQEQRHASRMLSVALWWSGDEVRARERMWREFEASAFTALADNNLDLAVRHMSWMTFAASQGTPARKAGDTVPARTGRRSSVPISVSAINDGSNLPADFPHVDIAYVDADGHA
ncbi:CDP-glycerol glycerophosphotransferase (TagB/SpsB family)/glycosyltransferase involved in cell wall biosynthesis/lipopolysaccharide biosynthesis regulator YciM [Paraburkholderia sp. GAS333]|uniref:CDP-glycerol glycerophosphotransferase family protein n=1 Tax=Paraburkholderia sp. GAS333 TaxID=3156279 RepID=UPI003D19B681